MNPKILKVKIWNWNCDLDEIVEGLKKKKNILLVENWRDADVLVLWNEIERAGWRDIIRQAQKLKKKVILYQQGIWGIDRVAPPFNEPIISDKVLVWGEGDKKRLISWGVPEKKIVITGSPVVKKIQELTIRKPYKEKNITFVLEHWEEEDVPENGIVAAELRKLKYDGIRVMTKALKGEHNLAIYDNVVATYRHENNHLKVIAALLSETDLVVAISESTFSLFAEVLDIPIVIADIWIPKERAGEESYKEYRHPFTDAITLVKLPDLIPTIKYQLKHPEIKREERKLRALENGGTNIKDPVGNIIKEIIC